MTFDIGSSPRQTDRPELSQRILTRMVQTARRESQADIDAAMFARERKSTFRTKTMIGENEHREERKTKTKKDRRKTIQEETRKKRQQQKRRKNHNQGKKTEETKTDPKTKTISIKKKPRASCTRLRG